MGKHALETLTVQTHMQITMSRFLSSIYFFFFEWKFAHKNHTKPLTPFLIYEEILK